MRIIITPLQRKAIQDAERLDKCELSKILHFQRKSLRARKIRAQILNFQNFILDGEN